MFSRVWQRRGHDREGRPESACGARDVIALRDRCAGQPLQLEQVGRGDRSQRQQLVADGLRGLPGDVELSRIAQNRIDADKGSCVGRLDACNRLRRSGHRLGRRKISGEDGIERLPSSRPLRARRASLRGPPAAGRASRIGRGPAGSPAAPSAAPRPRGPAIAVPARWRRGRRIRVRRAMKLRELAPWLSI